MSRIQKSLKFCLLLLMIASVPVAVSFAGIRLNVTPSAPLGIWLVEAVSMDELVVGEYVELCPPASEWLMQVAERAQLPRGRCDLGLAPFLKKVAATPGDEFCISAEGISVNGHLITHTAPVPGWPLPGTSNGTLTGTLTSDSLLIFQDAHPRSLDSRYLGPFSIDRGVMRARLLVRFGSWPPR